MMLGTFFLLFWACYGTALFFCHPSLAFFRKVQGLTSPQVQALMKQENAVGRTLGCTLVLGFCLSLVQYIVELYYPAYALHAALGADVLARIALGLGLSSLVYGLVDNWLRKRDNGGVYIYPRMDTLFWIKTVLFSLPTLYLWYLFALAIGAFR